MRCLAAVLLASLSVPSFAASPIGKPSKLDPAWQMRAKAMYKTMVEAPTVAGRNQMPWLAEAVAKDLRSSGWPAADIRLIPYEGNPGDKTVALIARWRADRATAKPILLMAHMDVVEAKRSDWQIDPFQFVEKDGYSMAGARSTTRQGCLV